MVEWECSGVAISTASTSLSASRSSRYWKARGARPKYFSLFAAARSRLFFHKSQTATVSTLYFPFSRDVIMCSQMPRLPTPMWPSAIRSFAPRIRSYDSAVEAKAEPATAPAVRVMNDRRLSLLSCESCMVQRSLCASCVNPGVRCPRAPSAYGRGARPQALSAADSTPAMAPGVTIPFSPGRIRQGALASCAGASVRLRRAVDPVRRGPAVRDPVHRAPAPPVTGSTVSGRDGAPAGARLGGRAESRRPEPVDRGVSGDRRSDEYMGSPGLPLCAHGSGDWVRARGVRSPPDPVGRRRTFAALHTESMAGARDHAGRDRPRTLWILADVARVARRLRTCRGDCRVRCCGLTRGWWRRARGLRHLLGRRAAADQAPRQRSRERVSNVRTVRHASRTPRSDDMVPTFALVPPSKNTHHDESDRRHPIRAPPVQAGAGLHDCRGPDAGARHWRHDRDLHVDPCGDAAVAARHGSGPPLPYR